MFTATFLQPKLLRVFSTVLTLALAYLVSFGAQAQNVGFFRNYIIVSGTTNATTTNTYYKTTTRPDPTDNTNAFYGANNLGTFVRSNGSDMLKIGGELNTFENSGYTFGTGPAKIFYRIYPQGSPTGSLTQVDIAFNNVANNGDRRYQATAASPNLLNLLPFGAGTYTLEIYIRGDYTFNNGNNSGQEFDSNGGGNYKANFTVTSPATTPSGQSTTWVSNANTPTGTNWLNSANWSNGVPTATSDALIPDHAPGTPSTVSPQLNDPNALYEVRNLNMPGSGFTGRSIVRLGQSVADGAATNLGATLRVYGNVTAPGGGLLGSVAGTQGSANPQTNSTLIYAGSGDQLFDGTFNIADVRVAGGGTKKLHGALNVLNTLTFPPNSTTNLQTTDVNGVLQQDQGDALIDLADVADVIGESETASVQGTLKASAGGATNFSSTFGNIGLDIATPGRLPSATVITRTTQFNFSSPNGRVGIKRIFGVSGGANNVSGGTITIVFHFLDQELNGLSRPALAIFRTASGNSGPFIQLGGVVNEANKTITLGGLTSVNTISANDKNRPLPVSLVAFNAVRTGANASLTWTTATETNNKGFEVEVSTDGSLFRTLAFVASKNSNSQTRLSYAYTDTEAGKVGTRYYRLRQVDLDGKSGYSVVLAVAFDGRQPESAGLQATVSASPNPFTDQFTLHVDGGLSPTRVVLVDMTGRLVRELGLTDSGQNTATLDGLSGLNAGVYLARVSLSDGSTKTVRVQKQ